MIGSAVAVIATDGAPASGKTTIQKRLKQAINGRVFYGTEAATALFTSGYPVPGPSHTPEAMLQLQRAVYEYGLGVENELIGRAIENKARVVITDRGIPTGAAYAPGGVTEWYSTVSRHSREELFGRYEAVLYFPSLASFNPELYEAERLSNPFRRETAEEAAALDVLTWGAWQGHPNVIRVPGELGLDAVYETVYGVVSKYAFSEVELKWRLLNSPMHIKGYFSHERMEQYYLSIVDGGELRYRRIIKDDGSVEYWETEKSGSGLRRGEVERQVSESRYETHKQSARGLVIQKDRFNFLDGGGVISVDFFRGELSGHVTLEREFYSEEEAGAYSLGSSWGLFQPILVTGDKRWSNARLAMYGLPEAV